MPWRLVIGRVSVRRPACRGPERRCVAEGEGAVENSVLVLTHKHKNKCSSNVEHDARRVKRDAVSCPASRSTRGGNVRKCPEMSGRLGPIGLPQQDRTRCAPGANSPGRATLTSLPILRDPSICRPSSLSLCAVVSSGAKVTTRPVRGDRLSRCSAHNQHESPESRVREKRARTVRRGADGKVPRI
jgi:hypothetical protein